MLLGNHKRRRARPKRERVAVVVAIVRKLFERMVYFIRICSNDEILIENWSIALGYFFRFCYFVLCVILF